MFVLVGVRDTIPVSPKAFDIPPHITIQDSLNRKYANKLIPDKGLALSIHDVLTAEDGRVTWGNGLMYYKVSFRLMLFAPFIGEVIIGKVISTTPKYIRVSVGFFRDIYIIPSLLPPNSAYDPVDNLYFWFPYDDDLHHTPGELMNTVKSERLYIDKGEPIRFRVDSLEWQDIRPKIKLPPPIAVVDGEDERKGEERDSIESAGWKIYATIAESGLGVVSWWDERPEGGEIGGEMLEQ